MTVNDMNATIELAERYKDLDDPSDPYPAELVGQLSRALLAATAECGRMKTVYDVACNEDVTLMTFRLRQAVIKARLLDSMRVDAAKETAP